MLNRTLWIFFILIDCNRRLLMFLNLLNEVEIECSHNCSNYKDDDNLSSLNKLLFGVEEAQELHRAQIKDKNGMERFDSTIEYLAQND